MSQLQNNYYFQHQATRYPELRETLSADVAIIGGGFTGVNTAIELAARGKSVVLLEAEHIGFGASGRNGGQMIRGYSFDPEAMRSRLGNEATTRFNQLAHESVAIVKQRIKEHDIDCDFTDGYCGLAVTDKQYRTCQDDYNAMVDAGLGDQFTLYSAEELRQKVIVTDRYKGGLVDHGAGHLHPYKLVTREAAIAQQKGAMMYERSPALTIKPTTSGHIITTPTGTVQCGTVVYCCNAYIKKLNWSVASRAIAAGSYVMATAPLTEEQLAATMPKRYAFCDLNIVLDYYRLSKDNRLLFGGRCNYSGLETTNIERSLRPRMEEVFPVLKGIPVEFCWGGKISVGFNRIPQIGALNDSTYYSCAYAGHGINNTHLAARILANQICDGSPIKQPTQDFALFSNIFHLQFPPIEFIRGPATSITMMLLRLKDMLFG